jgi:hypothetical protein
MTTRQRRKKPALRHTRLQFGRHGRPSLPSIPLRPLQPWESMDLSEYDEDLIAMKRQAEAEGIHVWIPKRGPSIEVPDPIDFGESLSDIVIRNRGREP